MIMSESSETLNTHEFEQFFDEVCLGEFDILKELKEDLFSEGQSLVNEAYSALAAEDWKTLQRAAHSLKSSTKVFGGGDISKKSAVIEHMADPETGPIVSADLHKEMEDLRGIFDDFKTRLGILVNGKDQG